MRENCPESGEEAVILLEDLERELDEPQHEVGREIHQGKSTCRSPRSSVFSALWPLDFGD